MVQPEIAGTQMGMIVIKSGKVIEEPYKGCSSTVSTVVHF